MRLRQIAMVSAALPLLAPALESTLAPVLSAPAWGADSPPAAPAGRAVENATTKARSLVRRGRFEEALSVLGPLMREEPADANVAFHYGLAALGASQRLGVPEEKRDALLDEAIAAFRAMLVVEPSLVRVRLELARAFFLKGEDGLATRHFERVLAGQPPAAVALNVNRFLNIMRARKRWSLRVGAALAPDSNISGQTREGTILIDTPFGRLPFTYSGAPPRSGVGVAVWAGGEYQHPVNRRWRLRAGGDIHRREYRGSRFDRMTVSGHLGPRWLVGRASSASLLASARQSRLADEEDWRDLGIRAEGRHRLDRRTTAHLNASRRDRRYKDRSWLHGPVTDLSGGVGWAATPTTRFDIALGWGSQRTNRKRERHFHRWGRLGVTVLLPYGFTVGGAGTLRRTDYEGSWAPFVLGGGPRRDLTRSIRLDVHNRAFTVGGFSPQVSLVQEQRTSNAQLHGYDRISGELRFVRLF
ncbi:MAG: surface lipoprotein assembly modifier [Defluviicoccus sp.]|nr:surface lipoprotein assembly modifier [Defluviicoccus sp.]MDE0278578.1 surface lipoprotein assembly modifier [Defluviicoccus sp.]